jgi:AcrR family transcriptional regulator
LYRSRDRRLNVTEPRARRAKGEDRIQKVLLAAEDLLTRRGAEGVSLRDVAEQVGISVGNLQYYFPTRAALLDAVFDHHADIFRDEFAVLAERVDGPRELLETLVDYWLGTQHSRTQGLFWYLSAISPHDDRAREIMDRVYGELPTQMAQWLREIHPTLSRGDALRRAASIASLIEGSGLFVGYGRTPHRDLKTLQKEIRFNAMAIADRPA